MSGARGPGCPDDGMNGWIILDKPVGLGSTQAVGAVKRLCRESGLGKVKTGHGGTLDPLASGVLPIALGEATKLTGRMLNGDKVYQFTIAFGAETDTLDLEGAVVAQSDVRPSADCLRSLLPRFTGAIEQVPPAYSALRVEGERAYDRARRGEEVAMSARSVTVHALAIEATTPDSASFVAHVSKGTYIRSLARDIARAAGSVGHVTVLRRTRAGPFGLDRAISLDFLEQAAKRCDLQEAILPLTAGLDDIPALPVTPDQAMLLRHGQPLERFAAQHGLSVAMDGDVPVALVEVVDDTIRVVRGFNL